MIKLLPILCNLLAILLCMYVHADSSNRQTSQQLTKQISYFKEPAGQAFTIEQAKQRFLLGDIKNTDSNLLAFGTGSEPVWVRINVNYQGLELTQKRLTACTTWVDRIDIYHFVNDKQVLREKLGDRYAKSDAILPGIGIVQLLEIPVGESEIFIKKTETIINLF